MVHLAKAGEVHKIHEVGWMLRKPITRGAYTRDLAWAYEMALEIHEWRGKDREGQPLHVVWVTPPNGRLLSAYEIQGRA